MTLRAIVLGTVVALAATTGPAHAAGVGGVEVTPPDGTSFRVSAADGETARQSFTLRNVTDVPATVRLYGAAAEQPAGSDAWSVAGAVSADWLGLPDQRVTLAAGESREMSFTVRFGEQDRTGAVVLELGDGTVVQRAATLVYAETAAPLPVPLLLAALAVGLVAVAAAAWSVAARGRPRDDAAPALA